MWYYAAAKALSQEEYAMGAKNTGGLIDEERAMSMADVLERELAGGATASYIDAYNKKLDVLGFFKICSITDVNTDHGFVFTLGCMDQVWLQLQLSFVGSYAVLIRVTLDWNEVIDPSGGRIPIETCIIDLLAVHGIRLLDKSTLELPIGLKLFDTDPGNVRVYQALFSDVDILPWGPVPDGARGYLRPWKRIFNWLRT